MKLKRFCALALALALILLCCACGPKNTTAAGGTTTGGTTPPENNVKVPTVTKEEIKISLDEAANAVKINATPATETQKIPLLIILVNFDPNGNGIDDYDENNPTAIKSTGEQWAGTELSEHYDLYFGDGYSLTNYYLEMTMGAFCFAPIQFDNAPESDIKEG